MPDKINVLIFPGGNEIGLEIYRSLNSIKDIEIFSAANDTSNHAPFIYKNHFIIPDISSEQCVSKLNELIKKYQINYLYPAHDMVIDFLIDNKKYIKSEIILPDSKIVRLIRSKKRTYTYFNNIIPTPKLIENFNNINSFPIFIKPDEGFGSRGAELINSKANLYEHIKKIKNPIFLEFLPGKEYTIDCFSSKRNGLIFSSARERKRIRMGTSLNGTLVSQGLQKEFENFAKIIFESLKIFGAWFFQMKEASNGKLTLLEIEPRIAGTMALNRVRGINFPLLNIYEQLNIKYNLLIHSYKVEIDRALKNRYKTDINYNSVYIDLDDTIILNNMININIIKFLYQCLNNKKKLF